jgi:hypothetical protein
VHINTRSMHQDNTRCQGALLTRGQWWRESRVTTCVMAVGFVLARFLNAPRVPGNPSGSCPLVPGKASIGWWSAIAHMLLVLGDSETSSLGQVASAQHECWRSM